jgi:hypothetical protein
VQRYSTVHYLLAARDLCATQSAGNQHFDALGASLHGTHHRLAGRPPEHHPSFKLLSYVAGYQERIKFRLSNL